MIRQHNAASQLEHAIKEKLFGIVANVYFISHTRTYNSLMFYCTDRTTFNRYVTHESNSKEDLAARRRAELHRMLENEQKLIKKGV